MSFWSRSFSRSVTVSQWSSSSLYSLCSLWVYLNEQRVQCFQANPECQPDGWHGNSARQPHFGTPEGDPECSSCAEHILSIFINISKNLCIAIKLLCPVYCKIITKLKWLSSVIAHTSSFNRDQCLRLCSKITRYRCLKTKVLGFQLELNSS